jgi:phosphatidate cytidylyltransferase
VRQRAISAAALVPVVAIPFLLGNPWLTIGIAALALLAGVEAAALIRRAGLPADPGIVVLLPAAAVLLTLFGETQSLVLAFPAVILALAAIAAFRKVELRGAFLGWAGGAFGAIWVAGLAFAALVTSLPGMSGPPPDSNLLFLRVTPGQTWLLILVLTVWACDTFAYVVGRTYPRGRMLPHLSPNKTWSGGIGGTVAGIVACAALTAAIGDRSVLVGALLGAVLSIAAQAGDAAESLLKRAAGAKDSGTLIPGHGGVLDRIDSFLFAAPALYITLSVLAWFAI